jgi:hypothetical protein
MTGACPDPDPNPDEFIGMRVSFIGIMGFPPLPVLPEPELIILPYTTVLVLATKIKI